MSEVYKAINAVQADLVKTGITKDSTNTFDNYKFRGIDAVYNALSPLLAKHGLCILPRFKNRACEERQSNKGGALFYVTVEGEFDIVATKDDSKHTICTFGEAMDRGDKATNKAMSAAYKYAAFQAFAIPTEGDNDADGETHEVAPKAEPAPPTKPKAATPTGVAAEVLSLAQEMCFNSTDVTDWAKHKHNKKFGQLDDITQQNMYEELRKKHGHYLAIQSAMDAEHGAMPDGLTDAEKIDRTVAYLKDCAERVPALQGKPLRATVDMWHEWVKQLIKMEEHG